MKKALITGVTGQDGAYLSKLLLGKGYSVHGTSRDPAGERLSNLRTLGIQDRLEVLQVNLEDREEVFEALRKVKPDEIYNLAGQSSVGRSFDEPAATLLSNLKGPLNLLEGVRLNLPGSRFYHSASSEMFGGDSKVPRKEDSPLRPRSPYAVGKAAVHWAVINYREAYGLFACSGIVFNHESPLRPDHFVTRKITKTVAKIKRGKTNELRLGDLSVKRDWGYAPEYVEAMWLMLQQKTPEDYVIATGEAHSLQEFVEEAFGRVGLDWTKFTVTDPNLIRPNEVKISMGDPTKANKKLDWEARTKFREIITIMLESDCSAGNDF